MRPSSGRQESVTIGACKDFSRRFADSLSMTLTATTTTRQPTRARRPAEPAASAGWTVRVVVLASLLVAATLVGALRVTTLVHPADPSILQVGRTTIHVSHVEQVTGLTPDDLSGMAHGIQGLVEEDQAMLRVSLTLSAGRLATDFDVSRLRLHSSASRVPLLPIGGSVGHGHLSAHARVDGAISFIVPRDGARFSLGSLGSTGSIGLAKVGTAPAGAGHMDMRMPGGTAHGRTHHSTAKRP